MTKAELVTIAERIAACRDSTNDKFLELAVNGHADSILTGDSDLLVLNPFRGIPIVNLPRSCRKHRVESPWGRPPHLFDCIGR